MHKCFEAEHHVLGELFEIMRCEVQCKLRPLLCCGVSEDHECIGHGLLKKRTGKRRVALSTHSVRVGREGHGGARR